MSSPITSYVKDSTKAASKASTHSSPRSATFAEMFPLHRLPVVAKTPFMVALGVYLSEGEFVGRTVGCTMLLGGLLWLTLYPLNEATDLAHEQGLHFPRKVWILFGAIIALECLLAAKISLRLLAPFSLMVLSQIAYCAPPLRLKRSWWGNVCLSGTLNPLLRLWCGVIWGTHGLSWYVYAIFIALHLGASLRARILLRERDRGLGYTTAPRYCEPLGMISTVLGLTGAGAMCVAGELPPLFTLFLVVATGFSIYAWTGRNKTVAELRRGWILFAVLAIFALFSLYMKR